MRSLVFVSPILWLCLGSVFVLTAGLWIQSHAFLLTTSLVSLAAAAWGYFAMVGQPSQDAFAGLLVFDSFGLFFALFAVAAVAVGFGMSARSAEIKEDRRAEYYSILLALCSGLAFMGIANHFLMIYLAIETVSILSYTLAGFGRERSQSVEAALKYVVYGSVASALMIYGMSLLYGATGEISLLGLREALAPKAAAEIPVAVWVGALLTFAGMGYKVSAAPMHMWTPDVYEGAPTPVSALLSVAPKAAGFALLARFFVTSFSLPVAPGVAVSMTEPELLSFHVMGQVGWPRLLMLSSLFTMFMGNLAALGQVSVKRILAYSSIAHAGYVLMGLTTQTSAGLVAMLFYLMLYCTMNLGAFWVVSKVFDARGGDEIRYFRGLSARQPFYAAVMAIFLFSLVGLPPFAGFLGKLYLFSAVIAREMYGFAVLAALNSVIALYYYMKIVKAMYLEPADTSDVGGFSEGPTWGTKLGMSLLALPNVALLLYWEPVLNIAKKSVEFFIGQ